MNTHLGPTRVLFFLLLTCCGAALSDVVVTKNDSRLVGQIKSIDEGKLTLVTDFAGDLVIEVEKIATITADCSWKIKMGVYNKYVSQPANDAKRLDTRYFVNLVWTLE